MTIGIFNSNWKGGHRRDEIDVPTTLTERELLVIKIEAARSCIDGAKGFEHLLTAGWLDGMESKLAEAEKALAEYDTTESAPLGKTLRMMDDEDGCGNDSDLYNYARGG